MALDPVWQYFLAIEADLAACSRFVEFTEDNFETYSIEFSKILLAAAAEVDVVCRALCASRREKAGRIGEYREALLRHLPALPGVPVWVVRYRIKRTPWEAWSQGRNPDWWEAYNRVKHSRHDSYSEANLKNAIDSVCGLMVVALYLHRFERTRERLVPGPQLLGLEHLDYRWLNVGENYRLPGAEPLEP